MFFIDTPIAGGQFKINVSGPVGGKTGETGVSEIHCKMHHVFQEMSIPWPV